MIVATVISILFLLAIIMLFAQRKGKPEANYTLTKSNEKESVNLPMFSFEKLPSTTAIEESKLVEIKDKQLLATIDNVIPNAGRTIQNIKAAQGLENAGELYWVIIPQGANLDHSRALEGAYRATFRDVPNNIQGQANLVKADGTVLASQGANIANAVMNVGSMIVGQYYMSEINNKLDNINDNIKSINDFQTDEYKSKIMSLGAEVKKISEYKTGTLENEEVRKRTLDRLDFLEGQTTQLLGQANLKLEHYQQTNIDYKTYEKQTKEADVWYQYQQILISILYEIDSLTYTLYMGMEQKEKCFKLFQQYNAQTIDALNKLNAWHDNVAEKLQIDIGESRRRREGFRWLASKFDVIHDWNLSYKSMSEEVVQMIANQAASSNIEKTEDTDLFQEDVCLIKKNEKVYYLPGVRC